MASARPRRSPGEPLTRRRASSFCGAGRSTEEEGGLTRTEHLAQTGMRPRVPQGALPWKALPRHHLTVPAVESGSAQGMLIKNIILIGLPWEEWRTLLRPGENAMLFFQDLPPLPRESLLPPGNLGVTVRHSPSPPPQREALGVSESVRANTRLGPVGKGGPGPLRCCRWWGGTGEDLRGGLALCSTLCCLTLGPKGLLKSPALPATPIRRRPRPTATRERSPPATVSLHAQVGRTTFLRA